MSRIVIYRSSLALCATVLSAGLFSYSSVYAADAGSRQIEEVIVTAERQEASIQDTSISITALTGEFVDDFGIRNQEDFQNFIPATTIQPYDATVQGVGRNFRALGGDPGVATYINGVYSEDLLTATAQTFWDIERIEVLRGPQGTLYGRNAVGGAINILYKQPTDFFEGSVRGIVGNFGTQEYYGAFSGPLIEDKLLGRVNFAYRDREGVIEEIGPTEDLDGLGTENISVQLQWTPTDNLTVDIRQNWLDIDRPFGGANGGGLVVLNEDGSPGRSTDLIPGFRFIDRTQTNPLANDFFNPDQQARFFTNPTTGVRSEAQPNRAGLDYADFDGFQNAAASLDGFNNTSDASIAAYNRCVFPDDIDGDSVCAATNGLNREQFDQQGTQFAVTWDATENLSLKYIYGFNQLSYQRTTDDDNTASQFHDRQFYVNHEADYSSHEIQAFWDVTDNFTLTIGGFIYDATIDQRGDFYSSVSENRFNNAATYNPAVAIGAVGAGAAGVPVGTPVSALLGPVTGIGLFTAKNNCLVANPGVACARNYSALNSNENLTIQSAGRNDNLVVGLWEGDDGTNSDLNVINGINSIGSDLLYATQTVRKANAVYAQGVVNLSEKFALTVGVRYAVDDVTAEENLFRYTETLGGNDVLARFITDNFTGPIDYSAALYALNAANGGFQLDANGNVMNDQHGQPIPTENVVNGGFPIAISVYRPFQRDDEKFTGRINLDWDITEEVRLYFSATSGYRSGGYNLVFFSNTAAYDPENLIAYEFGYKTRFFDNTLQINGSLYLYDYDTIHTVATEVTSLGGTSTSVLEAPGAEILGVEAEVLWLATEQLTLGGNFSFTPSEYTEDLNILDPARVATPTSLFPDREQNTSNINGNQLLQVPESKLTFFGTYSFPLKDGAKLDLSSVYSWTDEVYYSPFENDSEKAEAYGRLDLRATWTNAKQNLVVAGYVNNVLDDVAVLQALRGGESEHFRQTAGTTLPRAYGLEVTLNFGGN
ncbi:TonB-dependent receptor [Pseudomonadales bacterium]|nr:TonB-dependent receptor [Pseudomonadales bacterium]